ncbi:hypothetical protein BJV82DRAFT_603370 [Fennellomyces sp. T-0311]|nr:hypothetical protein BJV82DRAFT_603370 [Fennellomyces sp. T-0311]
MTKPTNELNNQAGIKRSRSGRSKQKRNPLKSILNDARPPATMQQKQKTKEVASRKQSASSGYSSNCSSSGSEGESGGDEDADPSTENDSGSMDGHSEGYLGSTGRNMQRETLVLDQQEQVVFRKKATRYGYLQNSFPGTSETTQACMELGLEVLGRTPHADDRIFIPHPLRKLVRNSISASRSNSVTTMTRFVEHYDFPISGHLPPSRQKHSKEQFRFLLRKSRFSRTNFDITGARLQNPCIGHAIYYVFYPKNREPRARLSPAPEKLTRGLIALTYTMLYFCMAKLYGHKTIEHDVDKKFASGSRWKNTYCDLMSGASGESVDWEEVIRIQQSIVDALASSQTAKGSIDLFEGSSEDTEDSNDNTRQTSQDSE